MERIPLQLIEKYSRPGPRYTSYPTAAEFDESLDTTWWSRKLREDSSDAPNSPLSLYLHIPFCHSLCYYCACNKIIPKDRSGVPSYLRSLEREAELYRNLLGDQHLIDHIHWGGGTPNYLTPDEIVMLHSSVRRSFPRLTSQTELSVEVDPRTLEREQLQAFRSSGFNRISFGVQDFDPEVQECINRIQSFESTAQTVNDARDLGFGGVNVDLIYGLPNQTLGGFSKTIEQVLLLNPDRIALYGYAHVTWVSKAQNTFRRFVLPTPQERVAIFSHAVGALVDAGYEYLGMDHFAKPSDELTHALRSGSMHRNFMGYTSRLAEPLIGLGVSSISSLTGAIAQNSKDIGEYESRIAAGELPTVRGIERRPDDVLRGNLIERILCERHVSFSTFTDQSGIDFESYFPGAAAKLEEFANDGLIEGVRDGFRVTELGAYFLRNIAMVFDSYLARHETAEKPTFSQAI